MIEAILKNRKNNHKNLQTSELDSYWHLNILKSREMDKSKKFLSYKQVLARLKNI